MQKIREAAATLGLSLASIVTFLYFETGEGKNASDTLGAITKLAYLRAVAKLRDGAARTAAEIVSLIQRELDIAPLHSHKLEWLQVKEVKPFPRPNKDTASFPVPGIQKLHHISCTSKGVLIGRVLACKVCLNLRETLCEACSQLKPLGTTSGRKKATEEEEQVVEELELDLELEGAEEEDGGASDKEEEQESIQEEEEDEKGVQGEEPCYGPGSVCWARFRRYVPVVVLSVDQVPAALLSKKMPPHHIFVKMLKPFDDVKMVLGSRLQELGETAQDLARAAKTDDIQKAYNLAVATVEGEV